MEMKKRMEGHLRMLCEEIGARPTGSEANRAAVEYACGEFERFGLSVSKQEFDCIGEKMEGLLRWKDRISLWPLPHIPLTVTCREN